MKETQCKTQNAALNVDLLKISCVETSFLPSPTIGENAIPFRNERISPCNLSINSIEKSLNIKDCGNEKPSKKNPYCTKQKINESKGNVFFYVVVNVVSNYQLTLYFKLF